MSSEPGSSEPGSSEPGSSEPGSSEPGSSGQGTPDLVITRDGPLLVRGPVVVELPDGTRVRSDRPVTALCQCRRTHRPPFCDTSHRRKVRDGGTGA